MDVTVRPDGDGKTWQLIDLLGRSMGCIAETEPGVFYIQPTDRAARTMDGMQRGHKSLDHALKAIETHTRGVCRLAPAPNDQP